MLHAVERLLETPRPRSLAELEHEAPQLAGLLLSPDLEAFVNADRRTTAALLMGAHAFPHGLRDLSATSLGELCALTLERICAEDRIEHTDSCTPLDLADLMADMCALSPGMALLDPVCGSAGLLVAAERAMRRSGSPAGTLDLHGGDASPRAVTVARLHLHIHGLDPTRIVRCDAWKRPPEGELGRSTHPRPPQPSTGC
ncbi:MAG: N-6 DNA methylase [Alphaproteobacteria bacterium]|nr:N-6 DNA methylase [Alphaproteobacteria bacterium]